MNNLINKQKIIEPVILQLCKEMEDELKELLDFWGNNTVDNEYGGFVGRIDHYGKVEKTAIKGAVLNARILWTFSSAYRNSGNRKYKKLADRAYHYLIDHFWDKENGGFYWAVDYIGKAVNQRKQTYAQGFGIYGLAEYYRATGYQPALEYARQLYYIIENKLCDYEYGGYIEALQANWKPLKDMRLSKKDANLPKSMNTHLHILEPYTCLYRVWPDKNLRMSIITLLNIFQEKIIDENTGHFNLFFEMDWTVKSDIISFGHDIEGAWLMHEAALLINNSNVLWSVQKSAISLVDVTLKEGLDKDGSLFNEKEGEHLDTDKHWWPQAEAMVGLLDAYEISGEKKYLKAIEKVWYFIKTKLKDRENAEWFWRVDQEGKPITTDDKVGFWKCPYHNGRALMEITERIERYL